MAATILLLVYKQWGKILGDTVNLKIINFPVSFNECFGGLALFNGDPVAAAEYATITDITNTNFKIYMYANNAGTGYANANIFYLFLGAQPQWGINSAGNNGSEGKSGWYAFPVNFNSACFALFCGLRNTDTNKPTNYVQKYSHVTGQPPNSTYTNKIMAVIHGLVVSFGLLLADSQPVTSYNPTATL